LVSRAAFTISPVRVVVLAMRLTITSRFTKGRARGNGLADAPNFGLEMALSVNRAMRWSRPIAYSDPARHVVKNAKLIALAEMIATVGPGEAPGAVHANQTRRPLGRRRLFGQRLRYSPQLGTRA
jgi:hypothetical protein